ncbi:hypothetical protein AB0M46_09960 [Dactylosporangium sp. NPDC051485]|uniref:hypothetical protein n=1 Tax=Dactylosporangium sp. NPDC051485 TaxID=3154846 RepID=UPI003444E81A
MTEELAAGLVRRMSMGAWCKGRTVSRRDLSAARTGLAVAMLWVLAGCTSGVVRSPSLTTQQPPAPVLTEKDAKGLVSLPWTLFSPVSSPQVAQANVGFEVSVPVTGCPLRVRGVTMAMTATTVVVAVMGDPSLPASSCAPSAARAVLVYVQLPELAAGHVVEHAPVAGGSAASTGR